MDILTLGAALLAGVLTILSPCILPILPIVLGSANSAHRWGPAALALGLATGFALLGLLVATLGASAGLSPDLFRLVSAWLLILFGLVLLVPAAQRAMTRLLAPLATLADAQVDRRFGPRPAQGLGGQFALGALLGAVWSPCVGPTLGAALLLASQGQHLGQAAAVMLLFGIGIAMPLVAIGMAGGRALQRMRGGLGRSAMLGKLLLGGGMLVAGLLVVTGWDKLIEIWFVENGPEWANALSTRF
ncbi:MAG: cytochrome c biogenesis CcdA family protein [Sphingopyxis sp.]|uniref:cytochrome c biogenesis CcdA family protein n=1 Tax=Sphingopyxis sp. TaxID=1908224 RepID=UPI002AB9C1FF|nr:cytochrome c biogenesis CcdA family protein [Sphingopyxis sp.]MDZ3830724.1 cytochrome c biogenesis CcdA family protein [Sphingopyxis sp.]